MITVLKLPFPCRIFMNFGMGAPSKLFSSKAEFPYFWADLGEIR